MLKQAQEKGYNLDLKPGNFGKRENGEIVYLDEGGIGKGYIPPDIANTISIQRYVYQLKEVLESVKEKILEQPI